MGAATALGLLQSRAVTIHKSHPYHVKNFVKGKQTDEPKACKSEDRQVKATEMPEIYVAVCGDAAEASGEHRRINDRATTLQ
jgi:hypothetical protein